MGMQHFKVLKQLLQLENDCEVVDDVGAEESKNTNSIKANALSRIPKPETVPCSKLSDDRTKSS